MHPSRVDFKQVRKILIVRDDRIGDVVLTLPMASAIKAARPDVLVHVLLRDQTAPLARRHPHVDAVVTLPDAAKSGGAAPPGDLAGQLRREHYDLAIIPHPAGAMAALIQRAGIPLRMGNGLRWHSWRYNIRVFQRRRVPAKHELDYNLDLLRPWMDVPEREAVRFHASWGAEAGAAVTEFLEERGITRYMIVHPGSGGSAVDLPAAGFAAWLRECEYAGHVLVTGSAEETALVETVIRGAGGAIDGGTGTTRRTAAARIIAVAGRFPLEAMMALIGGAEFFLANSTGPLHVARALERPLLGIYTTVAACHPRRWGPYAWEESHTLLPPGESFDRFEPDKQRSTERMAAITPAMITAAVGRVRTLHVTRRGGDGARDGRETGN